MLSVDNLSWNIAILKFSLHVILEMDDFSIGYTLNFVSQ